MRIIERRVADAEALVELTAEVSDATFYIRDDENNIIAEVSLVKGQSAKHTVPFHGSVEVIYSTGNSDTLYVAGVSVDDIKKATRSRFPEMKLGI